MPLIPLAGDLEPLLAAPREALDVEYKVWLDLAGNDEHNALLAKAAIAIANEGGGYIVIGLREVRPNLVSEIRPNEIAPYSQDQINQIIRRFATPQFHCGLTVLRHPETGVEHPVITVPGGFGFPVMSKSGTVNGSIKPHFCYMRKPGPESAPPENQSDWERLLTKCLRNRREDMLDAIRAIVEGKLAGSTSSAGSVTIDRQSEFVDGAHERWKQLTASLDASAPQRCPLGRYEFDYAFVGDFDRPGLSDYLQILSRAVVRHTGWPEFWVPTREGIEPYPMDDGIECWIGRPSERSAFTDPVHSDFWRASLEGRLFLLRGYVEDSSGNVEPGTVFDLTIPIWRVGECLLHAARLANLLAPDRDLRVSFRARWFGLSGRRLVSFTGNRILMGNYVCLQDEYGAEATIDVARIGESLPEIVSPLVVPLLERFGFFRVPDALAAEELARMRSHQSIPG